MYYTIFFNGIQVLSEISHLNHAEGVLPTAKNFSEIFCLAAKCEIISFGNCEISPFGRCEMKFASSHLRSKYFTAELFHMAKPYFTRRRRISLKKALAFASAFFCEEPRKRCVSVGKNAKKVRKVGKLVLNAYVRSREVKPKALSFL